MRRPYESLEVWQDAHRLNLDICAATRRFPREERYELTSQLRRAARSVPTNIVEGYDQFGVRSWLRFVRIALGSLAEADYLLLNARDEGYLARQDWMVLSDHAWRLRGKLLKLCRSLQEKAGE